MTVPDRLPRIPPALLFWVLAALVLVLGHDAIFLVQMGPGEALTRALRGAGHGYWAAASVTVAMVGGVAGVVAVLHLARLRRRARALGVATGRARRPSILATWLRLFAVVAVAFTVQENIEHAVGHGHMPGLGALVGPEYPLALPVLAVVTAFAALVAATMRATEQRLVTAIAAALNRTLGRSPRDLPRPAQRERAARERPMARRVAGRAPPRAFAPAT